MLSSANRKDDEKLVFQKESPFWVAYNIKESEDGVIDFGQPRFRTKENMVEKGWHSWEMYDIKSGQWAGDLQCSTEWS